MTPESRSGVKREREIGWADLSSRERDPLAQYRERRDRCSDSKDLFDSYPHEVNEPNDPLTHSEDQQSDSAILKTTNSAHHDDPQLSTSIDIVIEQFLIDRFALLSQRHQCQTFVELMSRTHRRALRHCIPDLIEYCFTQRRGFEQRSEDRLSQSIESMRSDHFEQLTVLRRNRASI